MTKKDSQGAKSKNQRGRPPKKAKSYGRHETRSRQKVAHDPKPAKEENLAINREKVLHEVWDALIDLGYKLGWEHGFTLSDKQRQRLYKNRDKEDSKVSLQIPDPHFEEHTERDSIQGVFLELGYNEPTKEQHIQILLNACAIMDKEFRPDLYRFWTYLLIGYSRDDLLRLILNKTEFKFFSLSFSRYAEFKKGTEMLK